MESGSARDDLEGLALGQHVAWVYDSDEVLAEVLPRLVRQGLDRHEQVLYVVSDANRDGIFRHLADGGLYPHAGGGNGELQILGGDPPWIRDGVFHPEAFNEVLEAAVRDALNAGYSGLRLLCDATWLQHAGLSTDGFRECAARTTALVAKLPCITVCHYDARVFDPKFLINVLLTYPVALVGREVCANAYCMPPEELLSADLPSATLSHWLWSLRELNQTRADLAAERDLLSKLLDTVDALVVVMDSQGRIVRWNRACEQTTGYSLREAQGRYLWGFVLTEEEEEEVRAVFHHLESGCFPLNHESHWVARDGSRRLISWSNTCLTRPDGSVEYVVGTGVDITERRAAEERSAHLTSVLRAVRDVNQLIARGHDRDRLLKGTCEALATARGYLCACILLPDEDGRSPRVVGAGREKAVGLIEDLARRGDLPPCAHKALSEPGALLADGTSPECAECLLADSHRDWTGVMCRLEHDGRIYGTIMVALSSPAAHLDEEQALFEETADDIAFALHTLEVEEESRRAEQALRTSEENYRAIFDGVNEAIIIYDLETGSLLDVNSAACRMYGYSREDFRRLAVADLSANVPPYTEEDAERFAAQAARGRPQVFEWQARHRDGRIFWVEVSLKRAVIGGRARLLALVRNIQGRRRAQAALRRSEQRFRELADLLPDMVYEADGGLRITYGNQAAKQVLGYTDEDLERGLTIYDLLPADQAAGVRALLEDPPREHPFVAGEYDVRRSDGTHITCEVHSSAVRDQDGRILGVRGVVRDITERKRVEEAQRLAAMGHLAAGVAHELNNILAAMIGRAELAQALGTPEAQEKLINTVLNEAQRGAEISHNLLRFARPSEPRERPLRLEDPIEAALEMAHGEYANAGIEVRRDYRAAGRTVRGDPSQLEQVFLNLIINACHAMSEGGVLSVGTDCVEDPRVGPQVVATVADTGIGIAAEALPRIFEPFFTTKGRDAKGGSGLGLSVSQRIVEAHGGTLGATSRVGIGTTFTMRLPACGEESQDTARRAEAPPAAEALQGHGRRVLVVEDEPDIRESIHHTLTRAGYLVALAENAEQGVEALRTGHFDAVVSDLIMPGGGGLDIVAAAGELDNAPPVLIITGVGDDASVGEALRRGAVRFLRKPFRLAELLQEVSRLVND